MGLRRASKGATRSDEGKKIMVRFTSIFGLALAIAIGQASLASAAEIKPAVVYDLGGKFDKSFNEGVANGAMKFKQDTGIDFRDFEIQNDAQREQALRRFAHDGYSPIVAVGFTQASALEKVAAEFPDVKFAIIDAVVDKPNVRSIVFKEQEGSFLVGLMAALASKTGKIGFVGGMDIPLIRKFACGYVEGAKYAKPGIEVMQNMTGTTGAAWNDPVKGGELAKSQMDRGADVVYHAAGGTGLGVLRAAADAGKLGIGVDSNQDGLFPGHVLTSMLKRVDVATYNTFTDAKNGQFTPGVYVLGLKENGVGYALDDSNKALVTTEIKAAADKASADIVAGTIKVHDYMADQKCPD
jgi:basic membrane protein A